jgi:hypothetical protein
MKPGRKDTAEKISARMIYSSVRYVKAFFFERGRKAQNECGDGRVCNQGNFLLRKIVGGNAIQRKIFGICNEILG